MNFKKVVELAKKGEKIRLKTWENLKFYIYVKHTTFYDINDTAASPLTLDEYMSLDWEVYKEEPSKDLLKYKIIPLPTRQELKNITESDFADFIERLIDPNGEDADIGRLLLKIGRDDRQNLKICFDNMANIWESNRIFKFIYGRYFDHKVFNLLDIKVDWGNAEDSGVNKITLVG